MAYTFTPKGEKEVSQSFKPLPAGEYPFTVEESGINLSKSKKNPGRPMCAVRIKVHGPDFDKNIFDYFADWFSEWKLKHFMEVTNRATDYVSGCVNPDDNLWRGLEGYVKIGECKNVKTGADDNEVIDYLPEENQKVESIGQPVQMVKTAKPAAKPATTTEKDTDDVPF